MRFPRRPQQRGGRPGVPSTPSAPLTLPGALQPHLHQGLRRVGQIRFAPPPVVDLLGHFLIGRPCGSLVELWSEALEISRDRCNALFSVHKLVGGESLR
jgi:hypothetical protein